MNIPLDEVIYFDCITTHPTTGAATDADSTPTFAVYEEATDTDIGVGGNLTKRTSLTGNYRGTFTLSAANGFEVGKWYSVIGSATVNSIAGKAVLKNFRVVAAEAIAGKPKVDVDGWLGTAPETPDTAGVPNVNMVYLNNSGVTVDNIGNVFGTDFATNYDDTNNRWLVDVRMISGDATAADNAEAFFDGTGYAGTNNVIPTVTTVTNQLTAAQIATGVWQDSTAGDFTAASSIGKALYVSNVAPGAAGGHMISGSNAGTTTFGAFTVTGATTYTGNVSMAAGLTVAQSSLNSPAILVTGNGMAAGIDVTGGATGDGITVAAGGGSGRALHLGSLTVDGTSVLTGAVSMGSTFTVTGGIVANITGNVTGNLSGSVGSVTGAVGSVTGAVGSVTGNVGGNVTGSIGSLATQAKADVNTEVLDVINVDTLIDGKTIKESIIIIASTTAGRVSGAGTGTEVFKGLDEATTRVTVTVDSSGNRTDVVYG